MARCRLPEVMTRYTVIWDQVLLAHFTNAWTKSDSPTRDALTEIASWVDRTLAVDPESIGRATRDESVRVVYVPVSQARVTVRFQVLPDDRQVRVVRMTFVRDR